MKKSVKAKVQKKCEKDGLNRVALGTIVRRQAARRGLSRDEMAVIVEDAASQMSRVMTEHDNEFSADRLVKMGARLGLQFELVVRNREAGSGRATSGRITIVDFTRDPLGINVHRIKGHH